MNFSERELLLRSWERLESSAIVIDAVTKGKHIQLAIAFLAQRLKCTHDEVRVYINNEIDVYVNRLLSNGQIFRAEHVLLNLARKPRYIFYEYVVNNAKQSPAAESAAATNRDETVLNYLTKAEWDFEVERKELDLMLRILETIQNTPFLHAKYVNILTKFNLEKAYEQSDTVRADMATDVLLIARKTFVAPLLRRREVWRYLLQHNQRAGLLKWLQALSMVAPGDCLQLDVDNSSCDINCDDDDDADADDDADGRFEMQLTQIFSRWTIDDKMMTELIDMPNMLSESVRNALATVGLFGSDDQLIDKLRRVHATESWHANESLLNSPETAALLIARIVENKWFPLLHHIPFDESALKAQAATESCSEKARNAIELCLALKRFDAARPNIADLTEVISRYFVKSNPEFYAQNSQLHFVELLLRAPSISAVRENKEYAKMLTTYPAGVRTIWQRYIGEDVANKNRLDYKVSLVSLVKKFMHIDLRELKYTADPAGGGAEDELMLFGNAALITQFGATERLGWLYYVKQRRSAYATFVFFIEHLRQYSRITQGL